MGDRMDNDIKQLIGERIKERRKLKFRSAAKLAEAGDWLPHRVRTWENGVRTPDPDIFLILGKMLDTNPAYLAGLSDFPEIEREENLPMQVRENSVEYNTSGSFNLVEHLLNLESQQPNIYEVIDAAMEPDIKIGQKIVVDENPGKILDDEYLIEIEGDLTIRHLSPIAGNRLYISATNPAHDFIKEPVSADQVKIVGRVIAIIR